MGRITARSAMLPTERTLAQASGHQSEKPETMAAYDAPEERRPLYVDNIPDSIHQWLESIKEELSIPKTDIIKLLCEYAMQNFTSHDINQMYSLYLAIGRRGLDSEVISRFENNK